MARIESDLFNYESHSEKDGVLINNQGIKNKEELDKFERKNTTARLALLYLNPSLSYKKLKNVRKFSVEHFFSIHKFLFDGIYPFAGEIRDDVIEKRIPFCLPQNIYYCLKDTLDKMDKYSSRIKTRDDLLEFITYYFPEIDIIHPFREGNGRSIREFIREFSIVKSHEINIGNYELDWSLIDKDELDSNLVLAHIYPSSTAIIFDKALVLKDNKNIRK